MSPSKEARLVTKDDKIDGKKVKSVMDFGNRILIRKADDTILKCEPGDPVTVD